MITLDDAFRKFRSRLELNEREQKNASARHTEVREHVRSKFKIECDFLTGSYARYTKTKPLKDVDIFFVLQESERGYRERPPSEIIDAFHKALVEKYGDKKVKKQARSICVDFGVDVDEDDNTDYRILSVDVVPAFRAAVDYEIPDTTSGKWIKTNPEVHADKATAAHKNYSNEWKGLVRMLKYWNNNPKHGEKPVKPSFLLEVMALDCLHGKWGGQFDREFQGLFATLANRIHESWPDPAGLGPPVSDGMDAARKNRAKSLLEAAGREATLAIHLARQGKHGEALDAWRKLFGPKFPKS